MTTGYGSLLALDSFASDESLRVAAYARALKLHRTNPKARNPKEIAEKFIEFVKGDRWRLDALDVVLQLSGRKSDVDGILQQANEIAEFVTAAPAPETEPKVDESAAGKPATGTKSTSKKARRSKK